MSMPLAIVVSIAGNAFAKDMMAMKLAFSGFSGAVILAGFILGIVALFGIRKHGSKGILVRAIIGIILNLAFLLLGTIGAMMVINKSYKAREKLEQERRLQESRIIE